MSENKYTAADFAAAEFAKRPNGGMAARLDPGDSLPWLILSEDVRRWVRDEDMAAGGWVPVPSSPAKPTITESETSKAFGPEYVAWARLCLARIGVTVVPDPEPTNAELLARDLDELNRDGFLIRNRHKEMIANLLIERGWVKQSVGEAR